ncbi:MULTISPECIES: hypothetical protein [unclassified Nocardioides]|uniref:hypothetical protein n=1 Tax=unclassified Nocardioides TaxID=2615069 RepID=UPI000B07C7B1|nr:MULTISPECIES: hypothetical protein [unclassified Nocardioides]
MNLRGVVLGAVAALFVAAAVGGVLVLARASSSTHRVEDTAGVAEPVTSAARATVSAGSWEVEARRILSAWDARRAAAYSAGDALALGRLYAEGAGVDDVRLLRAYAARGLHVEGLRQQVLAFRLVHREPRRLVVQVTDRLVGAVAVGRGQRLALPADSADRRIVTLVRRRGAWLVGQVR